MTNRSTRPQAGTFIVFLLLLVGLSATDARALMSDQDFRRPLSKCWVIGNAEKELRIIASDNESLFSWSPSDQSLEKWSLVDRAKDWAVVLEGMPEWFSTLDDGRNVVVTNVSGGSSLVRLLSGKTGLVVWQRRLPTPLSKEGILYVKARGSRGAKESVPDELVFVGDDSILRRLDLSTGILSEVPFKTDAKLRRMIPLDEGLLFPDQGRFELFSFESSEQPNFGRYQGEATSLLPVSDTKFAYGASNGVVAVYRAGANEALWEFKTGGAVTELIKSDDGLIAVSRDNYIYRLGLLFGNLEWKRRFDGRVLPVSVSSRVVAVGTLDSPNVEVIDLKNGKKLNGVLTEAGAGRIENFQLAGRFLTIERGGRIESFSSDCARQK